VDIHPYTGQYDVSGFTCGDEPHHADLNDFLKTDALRYAATSMSQTYIAVANDDVVGYVTLLNDAIWLNTDEKSELLRAEVPPAQTVPALKVGRLARHKDCKVPFVGSALMRFAFDMLLDISEKAGCRLLSVDAIPSAVAFYEKLGFIRNLHFNHAGKKRETTSMRFDAFSPLRPAWTTQMPLMRPVAASDEQAERTRRSGAG
jgi:ribosomal protein S18 acetylase RimI-like enzyme